MTSNDHIPTPWFLEPMKEGFFDPYPLNGDGPIEPPKGAKLWLNGGFSRKMEILEDAMRWHSEGHYTVLYTPFESSTVYGRKLTEYGKKGLYFETRPYEGCRGIEIAILTGGKEK